MCVCVLPYCIVYIRVLQYTVTFIPYHLPCYSAQRCGPRPFPPSAPNSTPHLSSDPIPYHTMPCHVTHNVQYQTTLYHPTQRRHPSPLHYPPLPFPSHTIPSSINQRSTRRMPSHLIPSHPIAWSRPCPAAIHQNEQQGILMRQRVDVKEWVLSAIARSGTGTGIRARGRRGLALHPSLLRVVCLYASACIPTSPPGRRASAILAGQGAVSAVAATADDFTMTPIFPTEVTEIVRAVDWVRGK